MTAGELTIDRPAARAPGLSWLRSAVAFGVVAGCLAAVAYVSVFSAFHGYDDEGYFLLTLKHYVSGRPLFTEALPIYGPFYYEAVGGVFKLAGAVPGHDGGRWLTFVVWIASSLVGGVAALRLTRSLLLGLAAVLVTFKALEALVNEPVQPAGLTSLLLLSIVAVGAHQRPGARRGALAIGALVGALLLVKVNVGAFAAMAVVFAWAAGLPARYRRLAWPLVAGLVSVAPFVLTARLLGQPWALEFAVLLALAAAGVAVASLASPLAPAQSPRAGWLLAGGIVVAAGIVAVALAGGTRAEDMWNGLVVLASQFPAVFFVPLTISPFADLLAGLSLVAAIAATWRRGGAWMSPGAAGLVRVLVGLGTWLVILLLPSATYLFAIPLAWLAVRPPDGAAGSYPRLLVPMLAVTAAMQDYPVAGTQLSLGALPLILAAAMTLGDGIRQSRSVSPLGRVARFGAPAALAVNAAAVALLAVVVFGEFGAQTPLALPGAQSVRVPAEQAVQLRALVSAVKANCRAFITIPGMDSLYLWTGQEPPAELSSEVWWIVLDSRQQQAILDRLEGRPGLCVVRNRQFIDFWAQGRPVPPRPLVQFIDQDFTLLAAYGDYQLLVRSAPPS